VYYAKYTAGKTKFYSYHNGKLHTLLSGNPADFAEFSPDGRRLAYVTDSDALRVANADGTHVRKLSLRVAPFGYGPNWTADGKGLIIARNSDGKLGVVRVSNGKFTGLPRSIQGIHTRMTPDGQARLLEDLLEVPVDARVSQLER
jgi:Tol biopolymer transport system component